MSKVIRITDNTYQRLSLLAEGFESPSSVIDKLLDIHDSYALSAAENRYFSDPSYDPLVKTVTSDVRNKKQSRHAVNESSRSFASLSLKAQGETRRSLFLERLKDEGIVLSLVKGVIYRTKSGKKIGIASASESDSKPGTWFLGIPKDNYHAIVLLCGGRNNPDAFSVVMPNKLIDSIENKLSMDSHGQMKFHVIEGEYGIFMKISGLDDVSLEPYINQYNSIENDSDGRDHGNRNKDAGCNFDLIKNRECFAEGKSVDNFHENNKIPHFENSKQTRLIHIYYVLSFMKKGHNFQDAVKSTLQLFPDVKDYQTISDKCARGFAGSVGDFIKLLEDGSILFALNEKFKLSRQDYRVFADLMKGAI